MYEWRYSRALVVNLDRCELCGGLARCTLRIRGGGEEGGVEGQLRRQEAEERRRATKRRVDVNWDLRTGVDG